MKTLKDIKNLVGLDSHHNYADIFKSVNTILLERNMLRAERKTLASPTLARYDEMQGTINGLKQLLELPESAGLTELFNTVEALELNKPQLSEIRYVLHGDIQPCSVLYSDDTTTLLRLDEGDIMCETDTIEWSDSVTYRCQELLKGESKRSNIPVTLSPVKLLAQLVRDERILLNDNGDDEAVEIFVPTLDERTRPVSQADLMVARFTPKQER
ncbi:hypothetical protein NVP1089O_94 [Vibrio phage 1.089.O._10N.261.51.F9]|nr:hypothetical protein NVP1012O_95 [Vibrio phage 1.012.O._10N.261.48.C12]AUR86832.1 hypothetical protein NVP1089O_94 [Vibrio phage 1.089.O._10N.261.51.F9]AUR87338.1 hypothetical protein NVP1098O_94 [Vibrio phage 1.098.O._10N.286.51.B9]AUR88853.1 hypothetical protein NVP1118A_93 [Vibrio phage 1.118.A._10N.261.49.F6]AUR88949.1 hypothetical protein NVP1118B_93 [Vibrio phage 1.118.B._10N.261.49.F6]AUR91439.1 hypothetical protein NVP1160O_90 [Vibrio phage 1.160.O._10N.261.48.B11]AUR97151.1 hypoth